MLKDYPRYMARFLVELQLDPETGEILESEKHYAFNLSKIDEYQKYLGYYMVFTSETQLSDLEIVHKYHGLSRIEDSFRITKSDLEGRPVFVRTPEHINAHFLTCFCALTMVRIIQHKILTYQGKDTHNIEGWESGLSADRIKDALNSWQAIYLDKGCYHVNQPKEDLQLILDAFGVNWNLRYPTQANLRQLKYDFDKANSM
ncbi:MAG: transposase [Rickettsiales bacterium]|jgi:hypothetical protein|nr:transposase [Rickettsiales bacterium]